MPVTTPNEESEATHRAAWPLTEWLQHAGTSRSYLYGLPREIWPETIRFGRVLRVIEPAGAWVRRYKRWEESRS